MWSTHFQRLSSVVGCTAPALDPRRPLNDLQSKQNVQTTAHKKNTPTTTLKPTITITYLLKICILTVDYLCSGFIHLDHMFNTKKFNCDSVNQDSSVMPRLSLLITFL
ncbi:hypothetical protein Tsp_07434 [Trichinella spiralis]|uniref:hypothetical protein n=1 Tax=Trichinella spiralis TaxID=6334 RepID=UPI0001EFCD4E|nr:hypothetical protein Tsp_07434 [Trichinella spiralis]